MNNSHDYLMTALTKQPPGIPGTLLRCQALCAVLILGMTATAWGGSKKDGQRESGHRDENIRVHDEDASYPLSLTDVRNIDGTNSSGNSSWGATFTRLLRVAPAAYAGDGSGDEIIAPPDRANPRTISNIIAAQNGGSIVNNRNMSDYVWAWGQFVDHDIDLTEAGEEYGTADIEIEDENDPLGPGPILFNRSVFDLSTGTTSVPRQQLNVITAFIDGSNVYGSDASRAIALRTFEAGRMRTGTDDLLPLNLDGLPNAGGPFNTLFVAGDVRANENVVLTSLHTIFIREHNRLARLISLMAPQATDEEVYQLARKILTAEMQLITYNEFLPALLGPEAPPLQTGEYDPTVDPSITNEFSTAIYRMGHSLLSSNLVLSEDGDASGVLPLQNAFFNPGFLIDDPDNVDRLLEGLAQQPCQEVDNMIVDDVRNFLFGQPGAGGLDLAMLNIQRGRDHGLSDYNTTRAAYGLSGLTDLMEISGDVSTQFALDVLYSDVNNIDAWVGVLAEDHVAGASVGATMAVGLREQFARLLAGDRFSVLNDPDLEQSLIQSVISLPNLTLADVVRANTSAETLPADLFFVAPGVEHDVTAIYDPLTNRVFVVGNRSDNHVLVSETDEGCLVMGRKGSRVNGERGVLFNTADHPSITMDLGSGDNSITFVHCDLTEVIVSAADGDDYLRVSRSSADTAFCNLGEGDDRVRRHSGFEIK